MLAFIVWEEGNMTRSLSGVGLGLRREMLEELKSGIPSEVDFWEIAPENWLPLGGHYAREFAKLTQNHQFVSHGLSLSIGSPAPLDTQFVRQVYEFHQQHGIKTYSDHLSYCSGEGHMYDLMPIPFTPQTVQHVVDRIQQVQDIIGRPLVMENVSYYAAPAQEMTELEFTLDVIRKSGCELLLDVNNIYVNSINHGYDADEFLAALPGEKIAYGHIAGHYNEAEDLIVDTHGADIIEPVWDLLEKAYEVYGVFPTLLERDFNIPPIGELVKEVNRIHSIQQKYTDQAVA